MGLSPAVSTPLSAAAAVLVGLFATKGDYSHQLAFVEQAACAASCNAGWGTSSVVLFGCTLGSSFTIGLIVATVSYGKSKQHKSRANSSSSSRSSDSGVRNARARLAALCDEF